MLSSLSKVQMPLLRKAAEECLRRMRPRTNCNSDWESFC